MQYLATGVGTLIVLVSLYLLVSPRALQARLPELFTGMSLYVIALVRLLVGCLLLAVAAQSRQPQIVAGLGWLTVLAALLLVAIPPARIEAIAGWYAGVPAWGLRLMLPLALAFGGYLIYAVNP